MAGRDRQHGATPRHAVQAEVVGQTDTFAADGRPAQQDVVLVEEEGYRVCGGTLGFG